MSHDRSFLEIWVGTAVIAVGIAFLLFAYSHTKRDTGCGAKECYHLKAAFERIDGIELGSQVTLSGIKVGKVVSLDLDHESYSAVASIALRKEIILPLDTSAEITSSSLLGDKYIALIPGGDSELLKDGDSIEFTQSSISFENILGRLAFGFDSNNKEDDKSVSNESSPHEENVTESDEHSASQTNKQERSSVAVSETSK